MVKAATMVGLLFAAAVVIPLACSPFGGASAFSCDDDTDCQSAGQAAGRCEQATGFCAFPDDSCGPLGRYGELSGGLSGQCVDGAPPPDVLEPDGPPVNPEDECFGSSGGLVEPCFDPTQVPAGAIALTANIDTDTSNLCSATVKNTTACVIAGGSISIANGVTVRATGSKALVLLATTTITIDGVIDVASHVDLPTPPAPGASANFAGCDPGTVPNNGGGGAGGSFGSLGGNGGLGRAVAASNGVAGAAQTPSALRGGCPGQDGSGAANFGTGGGGGGAIYLIATTISIGATGVINASGAGAINGFLSGSVGGGGGGSGGLIGLDAATITNAGNVFANGGGGGEGSGQNNPAIRTLQHCGDDPTTVGPAAGGSLGSTNGGDGGAGGATAAGSTGVDGSATGGGGGGGGGTGVIKVLGGGTLVGNRSPAPS